MELRERIPPQSRFPDGFRILQGKQEYVSYLEHSSIRIWPSNVASHFDYHMHTAVEILMCDRGVCVYQLQDEEYRVHPGEILILPSNCPHILTEPEDTLRHLLLFEPTPLMTLRDMNSIVPLMQKPIYITAQSVTHDQVEEYLHETIQCYNEKALLWNSKCYSYLLQMYVLLGQHYLENMVPKEARQATGIDPVIMNSAITYINEHYMDDLALDQVADFTGFSKYYFSRIFKQFAGVSFTEFLTRKRLNEAASLLIHTGQQIQDIATAVGFGSIATFNRVFREHKACSPSQFRAIYGSDV